MESEMQPSTVFSTKNTYCKYFVTYLMSLSYYNDEVTFNSLCGTKLSTPNSISMLLMITLVFYLTSKSRFTG